MLYAKVVFGLAVQGPFDYIIPASLSKKIKIGVRVWVGFRTKKTLGYVVKITKKSNIKDLKPILEVIDDSPVLDKNMLLLTKELSDYYCCSWGQGIETALPEALRKGRRMQICSINQDSSLSTDKAPNNIKETAYAKQEDNPEVILIHDLDSNARWGIYLQSIKEATDNNRSAIFLLPNINAVLRAEETIRIRLGISPVLLYRKQTKESEEWLKVKEGKVNIVVGTRSSIFAPLNNLGLVIIDEEQDSAYKQDQVPHYNSREVAFMRINMKKAKLILGSSSPSLESLYLARNNKIKYELISRKKVLPEIKIIDTGYQRYNIKQENIILSKLLEDLIISALNTKGKILLFLNRSGFATFASCRMCGVVLKCPRCNVNLVYHFKDNILNCHYCNFKMQPPTICSSCNSGYIRYSGMGTEKMESELSRLFPQARIKRLDSPEYSIDINEADIFISTKSIIKEASYNFELIGVLSIDNSLNHIDFRSTEKTFRLLIGLLGLTDKKFVIQTRLPHHYCFKALENFDIKMFYDEELRQRRQLNFPPYRHFGLVKLRSERESSVRKVSNELFKRLNQHNKNVKIISVNPAQPSKLRGKFCWQILCLADNAKTMSGFLKTYLKHFLHSGIIVTVDIDPL